MDLKSDFWDSFNINATTGIAIKSIVVKFVFFRFL